MIEGRVDANLEAKVTVEVKGPAGQSSLVEGVIDTGYSESLTLPTTQVTELGLRYETRGRAKLADGSEVRFDVYEAELVWDGKIVTVLVDEAETTPLVGMNLLQGHGLHIEVAHGGRVLIEPLPA